MPELYTRSSLIFSLASCPSAVRKCTWSRADSLPDCTLISTTRSPRGSCRTCQAMPENSSTAGSARVRRSSPQSSCSMPSSCKADPRKQGKSSLLATSCAILFSHRSSSYPPSRYISISSSSSAAICSISSSLNCAPSPKHPEQSQTALLILFCSWCSTSSGRAPVRSVLLRKKNTGTP